MAASEPSAPATVVDGLASFYGGKFHGRPTASGEKHDKAVFTAASNHFPLGSMLAVMRPANGLCVIVRVNDRMHRRQRARIVDISRGAADYLEMLKAGVVRVRVAPLRDDWRQRGGAACGDAFVPCPGCAAAAESAAAAGEAGNLGYNPETITILKPDTGLSHQ